MIDCSLWNEIKPKTKQQWKVYKIKEGAYISYLKG